MIGLIPLNVDGAAGTQYTNFARDDSRLFIPRGFSYDAWYMLRSEQTPRQRIMDLLQGTLLSSHQLAQLLGVPEREVEEHLVHVVKTVARDRSRRFLLEPSECQSCSYVFRDRSRLTRPSRCPRCRSEAITSPRYGIRETAHR
jgi:predicted Zn-ribbon and HTH transcriptional regulator